MPELNPQGTGRIALVGGRIVLPDRVVYGQALVLEAGRIVGSGCAW